MTTKFLTGSLLLILILVGSAAGEFKLEVQQFQLDNGLTILMMENHTAPVISYYTFYHVGTRNERVDNNGISHFFEHMFFNGAGKYGPKMFDKTIEAAGGYSNAWTSKDMTAYYQVFSSDILELVFDLESDRMASLALEEQMIRSEAGVVGEERLVSTDNDNQGIMWEELHAAAFMNHAYGAPVLGWAESIRNFNREDALEYFRTYYAPNNAVVTIVGDFDIEWALPKMKEYFGSLPSGPPPPKVSRYEPEQRGARRVHIEKQARHDHVMRGYHVCDKDSPDLFALEFIQAILTGGESSRLNQTLVNDLQITMGQYGGFSWGFDPQLFYFYLAVVPGSDYQMVEIAFDSVLNDFITNGPTDDEMTRAKNGLTADFYKSYKTNSGIASALGRYHNLYGDWKKLYSFVDEVNAVTRQQVMEVAAKYFTTKNSTTVVLTPEGGAQ